MTPAALLTAALAMALLPFSQAASSSSPLVPDAPRISFFWGTNNDSDFNIPQCSNFKITTSINPGVQQPVPPFYFLAAPVNGLPYIQTEKTPLNSSFFWLANQPVGTQLSLAMTDSTNTSGGSVGPYTITQGSSGCTMASTASTVSLTVDPPNNPCDVIDLEITGGKAPYVVSQLSPGIGRYANVTGVTSKKISISNNLAASTYFYFFVTDATGVSSQVTPEMFSALGQSNCVQPGKKSSGTSLAGIIGGAVGGVLIALVLLLAAYYFYRRRKIRAAEEAHKQELAQPTSDYRLADGTAPLVTPFFVPQRSSTNYSMVQSHEPTEESHNSNSMYGGSNSFPPSSTPSYSYNTHSPPPPPSQYSSPPPGSLPYPGEHTVINSSPSPTSHDPHSAYPSYESSNSGGGVQAGHSLDQDGLVHPESFEYRGPSY